MTTTAIARRVAAILLLGPALDDNYRKICAEIWPWREAGAERG